MRGPQVRSSSCSYRTIYMVETGSSTSAPCRTYLPTVGIGALGYLGPSASGSSPLRRRATHSARSVQAPVLAPRDLDQETFMSTPRRVTAIAIAFLFLAVSGPQRLLAQDGVKPPTPPETPSQPPATPPPSGTEQFGQEVTLTAKTMVLLKASGKWDSAFDSIVDAFKTV